MILTMVAGANSGWAVTKVNVIRHDFLSVQDEPLILSD